MTLLVLSWSRCDRECLILETTSRYLLARVILHIEQVEMILWSLLLTWHLILISLKCWAWVCQCVDYPQLLHLALVGKNCCKVTRVWRPYAAYTLALAVEQLVGVEKAVTLTVAKVWLAIGCDLCLNNCCILLILLELLIVLA